MYCKRSLIAFVAIFEIAIAIAPCPVFQSGSFYHGESQDVKSTPFTFVVETLTGNAVRVYNDEEIYNVKLRSDNSNTQFQSFLIQPRTSKDKVVVDQKVGEWISAEMWTNKGIAVQSCDPLTSDSVARISGNDSLDVITLKWKAPKKEAGPVQFVVTVIADPAKFWESWLPESGLILPDLADKSTIFATDSSTININNVSESLSILSTKATESSTAISNTSDAASIKATESSTITTFKASETSTFSTQTSTFSTSKASETSTIVTLKASDTPIVSSLKPTETSPTTTTTIAFALEEKTTAGIATTKKKSDDPCDEHECRRGSCVPNGTKYDCKCPDGFVGPFCQWECPGYLCQNGGTCSIDEAVNYICFCKEGFTGTHCDQKVTAKSLNASTTISISTISSAPSLSTISIITDAQSSSSTSSSTFSSSSFPDSSSSSVSGNTFSTTLATTVVPTEPSAPVVHSIFNKLISESGGLLDNGLLNLKVPNACIKNECQNGAECIPNKKGYTCKCRVDFGGPLCQWGCPSYLCQNGGTCWIDEHRVYKCNCTPGFLGEKCEAKNQTEVIRQPRPVSTTDFTNSTEVWLAVKSLFIPDKEIQRLIDDRFNNTSEKFQGDVLQQIDEAPIDNRRRVKFIAGAETKKNASELLKILIGPDFCENFHCFNNGTCFSNEKTGKAECRCAEGWSGEKCALKNYCAKHQCDVNSLECVNGDFDYTCKCRPDFSGKYCNVPCPSSTLCSNGAQCFYDEQEVFASKYKCKCLDGFTGDRCQTQIDECAVGPCYHGATCFDKVNDFECKCTKGYMGKRCDKPCQDTFKNCPKWKAEGKCKGDNENITRFFTLNCPASCEICVFDNTTIRSEILPRSPLLEPIEFLLGKWYVNNTDYKAYPFDLNETKSGYYQEITFAPSELFFLGNPSFNYTSIIINNDKPDQRIIRAGLITIMKNGTVANATLYTTGTDDVTMMEEGDVKYNRLEMMTEFLHPETGIIDEKDITIRRSFSITGTYLKEFVERKSNTTETAFTKYYFKA